MRAYFLRQIEEIAADPGLRAFGAALAAIHGLTSGWLLHHDFAPVLTAGQEAICWPLLPECHRLRVLSAPALAAAFKLYGAVSVMVAAGFLKRKWTGRVSWGLVLLTIFKILVLALDFRLRRNQHYMAFAVTWGLSPGPEQARGGACAARAFLLLGRYAQARLGMDLGRGAL